MASQTIALATDTASPLLTEYMDKTELAQGLRRTVRSLDRLILKGGGPPHIQLGNKKLFRREAVLAWLRSRETPAPPQSKRNWRAAR